MSATKSDLAYDPDETDAPHNLNAWGANSYWATTANDPPVAVEVESERWRTYVLITLASGHVHTFVLERESSKEQGCWHFMDGQPVLHRLTDPEAAS